MTRFAGNPENKFSLDIRDTNAHHLPDGTASHGGMSAYRNASRGNVWARIINTLDQDVTVTLQGTTIDDESDWTNPGSETGFTDQTVSASGGVADFKSTFPWDAMRVEASASVAPTSGSLTVEFIQGSL